jgi:nitrite reductase/ring-hydroxylating ferredoxin subunit/uncharacterized membrane protein
MRSRAHIAGHPIHPMLVAFPIGLWVTGFIFDLLGELKGSEALWAAGFYCIVAGIVGAVLSAGAGIIDYLNVVPPKSSANNRALLHGGLNSVILLALVYVAFHRGSAAAEPDRIAFIIEALAVVTLGVSGWLGGTLAYRNQIGVDRRYAGAGQIRQRTLRGWDQPVCNQSELSNGQMMLADVRGERIVVGKCSEGLFAFSDHCTHKGGPLHDGALVDCTVQCPWHGSQFDIRTGRVVAGPAEDKIDIFEVEVRKGEVFVSPNRKKDKAA